MKAMRITVERLRTWIVGLAALLVVALLLFFAYARWQVRRIGRDLPAKLGIQIQQSTNGFTFSKSQGGHTLFTLHASKAVQFRAGGHTHLHDVSIVLYGPDGSRADRISGSDFDYDPATGIARADGDVDLALQAPSGTSSGGTPPSDDSDGRNTVHVRTAGLVFNQKTGQAGTTKKLEFRFAQAAGSAVGASYDSHQGTLILDSAVAFNSSANGRPLALHARHAQFDRTRRELHLLGDTVEFADSRGSSDQAVILLRGDGSAECVDARGNVQIANVTSNAGANGNANAASNVGANAPTTDRSEHIEAASARVLLDRQNQPQQILLDGGLLLTSDDSTRALRASSGSGTLWFSPEGSIKHAQLRDAVSVLDQEKASTGPAHAAAVSAVKSAPPPAQSSPTRALQAVRVDIAFTTNPEGQVTAQQIVATGNANAGTANTGAVNTGTGNPARYVAHAPAGDTSMEADRLVATLRDGLALAGVDGTGHTRLTSADAKGATQSSTGDTLQLTFSSPQPARAGPQPSHAVSPPSNGASRKSPTAAPASAQQLVSAVQQGHVVLTQIRSQVGPAAGPGVGNASPMPGSGTGALTATADRATYRAADQTMRLEGNPRIVEGNAEGNGQGNREGTGATTGEVTAQVIDLSRVTGQGRATGDVKAIYRQPQSLSLPAQSSTLFARPEPVHIVADHALLDHARDLTTFFGTEHQPARLWQGDSSIAAPRIELSPSRHTLRADSPNPAETRSVHAVFDSAGSRAAPQRAAKSTGNSGVPGAAGGAADAGGFVRLDSRTLLYSDAERRASFAGGVVAEQTSGTIRAATIDAYFLPPGQTAAPAAQGSQPGGQVDKIIAQGGVLLEQPGRHARGDRLVYTADEGSFVLTGTPAAPPRLTDDVHGNVTGISLLFNNRDDSVMVSGGAQASVTETRVAK